MNQSEAYQKRWFMQPSPTIKFTFTTMIIGLAGDMGSGKETVAVWLREHHGFLGVRLRLSPGVGDHCPSTHSQPVAAALPDTHSENEIPPMNDNHAVPMPEADVDSKDPKWAMNALTDALHSDFDAVVPVSEMSAGEFMEFVLRQHRWHTHHWVVWPVQTERQLAILRKRPFFFLLGVQAPLLLRYERFSAKYSHQARLSLEQFCRLQDQHRPTGQEILDLRQNIGFHHPNMQCSLNLAHSQADLVVENGFLDTHLLFQYLDSLEPSLMAPERLRPAWDCYFMLLADLAARRSNCMKRQVGCILVRNGRVLSTGYNGTPRGIRNCLDGGCPRCNGGESKCGQNLNECLCLHAEENALLEAGRERIDREGGTLYCNTCPCLGCAKKIVQAGVSKVVYRQEYGMDGMTARLFREAGVEMRQYRPAFSLHLAGRL